VYDQVVLERKYEKTGQAKAHDIKQFVGDVNVLDLDLYDGKVATTREDAGKYMQAVKEDRAVAIIKAAIAYVGPKVHPGAALKVPGTKVSGNNY